MKILIGLISIVFFLWIVFRVGFDVSNSIFKTIEKNLKNDKK